jgi:hypothetical protein
VAELPENPSSNPGTNPSPNPQYSASEPPPFQPVATTPYQPIAGQPQPAFAPAKSGGNTAVKIVLIIVAVFVCLGILGASIVGYGIWRVSRAVHMNSSTGEAIINTPSGSFSANPTKKFTADELGIDIYPGASQSKEGMRLTLPTGSMIAATYVTSDSKDQVVSYYKDKLGSQATTMDTGDGALLSVNKSKQDSVMVTVTQKESQAGGKTQIHIVHTVNNKSS